MKKALSVVLTAAMMATLMAGCGDSTADGNAAAGTSDAAAAGTENMRMTRVMRRNP